MSEPFDPAVDTRLFPLVDSGHISRIAPLDQSPTLDGAAWDSRRDSSTPLIPKEYDSPEGRPTKQMEKIKKTQAAIDDVKDKLQENIMAINERGERLEDLQTKSASKVRHKTQAVQVRRKMWWNNAKWKACLAILAIVIIASAIGGGIESHKVHDKDKQETVTATSAVSAQSQTAVVATTSSASR